jgi:pyrroloquinoline quinone biosynthesis protein D
LQRSADGAAFLLVPEGIVDLNEPAGDTLELLDGERDADALANALAERYDAPPAELLDDVRTLLAGLAERGFLVT